MGILWRIPRRALANEACGRHWYPRSALRGSRVCDWRAGGGEGTRDARRHRPDGDDRARRREGRRAGCRTSRTLVHRTREQAYVPGTFAGVDEMLGIGRALAEAGHGVFEIITDVTGPDADLQWMADLTIETGRPINLAALISR